MIFWIPNSSSVWSSTCNSYVILEGNSYLWQRIYCNFFPSRLPFPPFSLRLISDDFAGYSFLHTLHLYRLLVSFSSDFSLISKLVVFVRRMRREMCSGSWIMPLLLIIDLKAPSSGRSTTFKGKEIKLDFEEEEEQYQIRANVRRPREEKCRSMCISRSIYDSTYESLDTQPDNTHNNNIS